MVDPSRVPSRSNRLQAAAVGLFTGILSAITLNPLGDATHGLPWWPGDLFGFLSVFALSAGLIFGLVGGAFGRIRLAFTWPTLVAFFLSSVGGMAAAVYAAMIMFDPSGTAQSLVMPYLVGSLVGALAMAIPVVFLGRHEKPALVIGRATLLTTLWSGGVAIATPAIGGSEVTDVQSLIPLFTGWQALFLVVLAGAQRTD